MDLWLKSGTLKKTDDVNTTETKASPKPSTSSCVKSQKHTAPSDSVQVSTKTRKYDDSYLSLGFTCTGKEEAPGALCLICNKMLSNSSLAPAKLRRHMELNHPTCQNKDISYFKRKLENYNCSKGFMSKKFKSINVNATMASLKACYRIALAGESHLIGESLIKPCLKDIVSCMFDEDYVKIVESVSLSNNTVSRRINDIANDIKGELISRLHICDAYALQLDESTDVAGLAILLVFIRYDFEKSIEEDLLLCESLELNTTGENIFKCIDNFMKMHNIKWEKCIAVCSDGAKAMTGKVAGAISRIKNVAKTCDTNHCILHRYALVTKRISDTLKLVLDEAVLIINFIKTRPLQSRIFKILCEDMGSLHTTLLLHTEVRWLSRGNILARMFELRHELLTYFIDHKFRLSDRLINTAWLLKLAYLSDIFSKLNDTCLSLQGKEINVFQAKDKLESLTRKLKYWISAVEQNNFDCFPILNDFLQEFKLDLDVEIYNDIKNHLCSLLKSLNEYFPQLNKRENNYWVQNPFKVKEKPTEFTPLDYEKLIDMISDTQLKSKFEEMPLTTFWCTIHNEYSDLSKRAIRVLLPFATTYLCESGFSRYANTKTKYRNRLDARPDMRIQLSNIQPNFETILKIKKQLHPSH